MKPGKSRQVVLGAYPISTRTSTSSTTATQPINSSACQGVQGGQGMVEYAFVLALVSLVIIVMLITTGSQVRGMYSDIMYTLHNEAGL
jgi:Flp pilus assembly pilin Flp